MVFVLEYGFCGNVGVGEIISDGIDVKIGLFIWFLYGKIKKLMLVMLVGIDILVFDI